jgi:hypothetical protein
MVPLYYSFMLLHFFPLESMSAGGRERGTDLLILVWVCGGRVQIGGDVGYSRHRLLEYGPRLNL